MCGQSSSIFFSFDEDLELVVERLSSFPRFTAIEKNWFNVGVENADLSVYG